MKKTIWMWAISAFILISLAPAPQVWGGMSDLENLSDNLEYWSNMSRSINAINNNKCPDYWDFRDSLGMKIADANNGDLAAALGIQNGISIDATTTQELKAVMLGTENICVIANAVAETLPANN